MFHDQRLPKTLSAELMALLSHPPQQSESTLHSVKWDSPLYRPDSDTSDGPVGTRPSSSSAGVGVFPRPDLRVRDVRTPAAPCQYTQVLCRSALLLGFGARRDPTL